MKTHDEKRVNLSEDPSAYRIAVVGVVGAVLVFAAIVWLQALFYRAERAEVERKTYSEAPEELSRVRAEQLEALNSYRWIDRESGVVSIPIERAMELVAREAAASSRGEESGKRRGEEGGDRP